MPVYVPIVWFEAPRCLPRFPKNLVLDLRHLQGWAAAWGPAGGWVVLHCSGHLTTESD